MCLRLAVGRHAIVGHEDVAESPHRLDVARIRGIGLDQLAQSRHLHVDGAIEEIRVASARKHHELLARERLPGMAYEYLDERELSGGEMNRARVVGEGAGREVELERTERH